MKNIENIYNSLFNKGISLRVEGGVLKADPEHLINPKIFNLINENKTGLRELISLPEREAYRGGNLDQIANEFGGSVSIYRKVGENVQNPKS